MNKYSRTVLSTTMVKLLVILSAMLTSAFTSNSESALNAGAPPGPDRFESVTVAYTAYEWWMVSWSDNQVTCSVIVDHEGTPTANEVHRDCGQSVYGMWMTQKPCVNNEERGACEGYYAHLIDSRPAEKEVLTELPAATAWISLEGCKPLVHAGTSFCRQPPALVIRGEEPLSGESIIRIEGRYDDRSFFCEGTDICTFVPPETGLDGVPLEFWAHSSYGDSSPLFQAQVRVSRVDGHEAEPPTWYVDVLSSQWLGQHAAACADWWGAFPPVGGPPDWLTSPVQADHLASDVPYTYLASNLIRQGVGSALACADGGLVPGGEASPCGLESAHQIVNEWQNQFDELIMTTAQETGVPARLLKNLFARESQFWPGQSQAAGEMGLGHLTEEGADTTLAWNASFYNQFCPAVLAGQTCNRGYMHLHNEERLLLRQALVASVNATCTDCLLGWDTTKAGFSVNVFAQTLLANCRQTGQVVRNYTGGIPGESVAYEDLWKLTLVNYNAGPKCVAEAISNVQLKKLALSWENIASHLPSACARAIDYVNDISQSE